MFGLLIRTWPTGLRRDHQGRRAGAGVLGLRADEASSAGVRLGWSTIWTARSGSGGRVAVSPARVRQKLASLRTLPGAVGAWSIRTLPGSRAYVILDDERRSELAVNHSWSSASTHRHLAGRTGGHRPAAAASIWRHGRRRLEVGPESIVHTRLHRGGGVAAWTGCCPCRIHPRGVRGERGLGVGVLYALHARASRCPMTCSVVAVHDMPLASTGAAA